MAEVRGSSLKMESKEKSNFLEKFTVFMENNMEKSKVVNYGIAGVGLILALYRVRPFTKIKKPSDVPSLFLRKRIPLQGTVRHIEPSGSGGTLLMLDHRALIPLPRFGIPQYLPLRLSGLEVNSNGLNWLQAVLVGKKITFVPLEKKKDCLECIASMEQPNQEIMKIGEELTKLGFATVKQVAPNPREDKAISAYRKSLRDAQKLAQRKRNGYWHFARQPTILWKMQQKFNEKIKSILPAVLAKRLDL